VIVGVPRETKRQEYRVALLPELARELAAAGHEVLVETGAGLGAGYPDEAYSRAGAEIASSAAEVYARSEMILKVKEPLEDERRLLREGQVLFSFLHLAADERLTRALLERKVVAIAFETVETDDGVRPILAPMSEIAGRLGLLAGATLLERPRGGRGVLLGGPVGGAEAARVLVIGAGTAGTAAASAACGLGARVTLADANPARLERARSALGGKAEALPPGESALAGALREADLVVCAVLRSGARAPHVITRAMLGLMKRGSVIVDISIDQGGCVETSRPTTHDDPAFEVDGVLHYCVANIPGAVPVTASQALARAVLPWALEIARKGWRAALRENPALARGLATCRGELASKPVAAQCGLPYCPPERLLL